MMEWVGLAVTAGRRAPVRAALAAVLLGCGTTAAAAELQPQTVAAWNRYVEATERRIAAELEHEPPGRFLVQDFREDAAEARRQVLAGRVRIDRLETRDAAGERIRVPKGAIHHWLGSALIPGVTLDDVLHALIHAVEPEALQDDVIESRVLARPGEDRLEVFLKLRRKQMVTVHYNTEHAVAYVRHRPGAASSRSVATRIAELDDAGTAREREKPIGRDRGVPVAAELLLAVPGGRRGRHRRVRVAQPEPGHPAPPAVDGVAADQPRGAGHPVADAGVDGRGAERPRAGCPGNGRSDPRTLKPPPSVGSRGRHSRVLRVSRRTMETPQHRCRNLPVVAGARYARSRGPTRPSGGRSTAGYGSCPVSRRPTYSCSRRCGPGPGTWRSGSGTEVRSSWRW